MHKKYFFISALTLTVIGLITVSGSQSAALDRKSGVAKGQGLYLAYCWVCHGPNGRGDGPYASTVADTPQNLTDSAYFSSLTDADIYSVISKGGAASKKSPHMKPMGFRLNSDDIWDLVAFIRFLNGKSQNGIPELAGVSAKELYGLYCTSCHGKKGRGDGPLIHYMPKPTKSIGFKDLMDKKTDEELFRAIAMPGKEPPQSYMPSWNKILSKKQINDLIAYIRNDLAK